MAERSPSWITSAGPFLQAIVIVGSVSYFAISTANKTDTTAADLAAVKRDVADIRNDTKNLPGYLERVSQLEQRNREFQGAIGALDARVGAVERKTDVNASEIAGIRSASGLRGK